MSRVEAFHRHAQPFSRGVQTDAALDADRLQGDLLAAAADEHIGARAHPDGGRRRSAAVGARDSARRDIARCEHQPHQLGFLGEADVDAEFLDRAAVLLGGTVGAGEQAAQILRRTEDEADAPGDIAGERPDVGAGLSEVLGVCVGRSTHEQRCGACRSQNRSQHKHSPLCDRNERSR